MHLLLSVRAFLEPRVAEELMKIAVMYNVAELLLYADRRQPMSLSRLRSVGVKDILDQGRQPVIGLKSADGDPTSIV